MQYHRMCLEHYIFKEDNIKKNKTLHQQYEVLLFNYTARSVKRTALSL